MFCCRYPFKSFAVYEGEQIRMEHINRVTQETQHHDIAEVGNGGGTAYEKGSTSYS
jgi:hypothetical protein